MLWLLLWLCHSWIQVGKLDRPYLTNQHACVCIHIHHMGIHAHHTGSAIGIQPAFWILLPGSIGGGITSFPMGGSDGGGMGTLCLWGGREGGGIIPGPGEAATQEAPVTSTDLATSFSSSTDSFSLPRLPERSLSLCSDATPTLVLSSGRGSCMVSMKRRAGNASCSSHFSRQRPTVAMTSVSVVTCSCAGGRCVCCWALPVVLPLEKEDWQRRDTGKREERSKAELRTHTHAHTHTRTHIHTRTHTHARTHTHTCMHTPIQVHTSQSGVKQVHHMYTHHSLVWNKCTLIHAKCCNVELFTDKNVAQFRSNYKTLIDIVTRVVKSSQYTIFRV